MVPVHEELCLCAPGARADGRRVELIIHAALTLRLLLQDISASSLRERLDPTRRTRTQAEQHERPVVRTACTDKRKHRSASNDKA
jgi:hypothetical protein